MSLSHLSHVGSPLLPVARAIDKPIRRPLTSTSTKKALPLRVRSKANQSSQAIESLAVSRRDLMLSFTAASLSGVALLWPESAEARVDRGKMRRKFMEKLDMLKEKAGLSKPKTDDGVRTQPPEPLAKEKKGPPPAPNPLIDPVLPLVEAVLP